MLEFKKSTVSSIDDYNWIYIAHHELCIFSLQSNETIYIDKEPFCKKYNQVSNIIFSKNSNSLVLISFKGDCCIYNIDHKTKKVEKRFMYLQKGDSYCSDVEPIWIENNCLTITMSCNGKLILRSIFFDGHIKDAYKNYQLINFSNQSSFNELLIKENDRKKIYLGSQNCEDFIFEEEKYYKINKKANLLPISIFTNEGFSKKILVINDNKEMNYYDYSPTFAFLKKYKKENSKSTVLEIFSKLIGDSIVTFELIFKRINSKTIKCYQNYPEIIIPYISGFVFDDGNERIVQTFSDEFVKKNRLLSLTAFNSFFASFVSENNSIVVVPIKKSF